VFGLLLNHFPQQQNGRTMPEEPLAVPRTKGTKKKSKLKVAKTHDRAKINDSSSQATATTTQGLVAPVQFHRSDLSSPPPPSERPKVSLSALKDDGVTLQTSSRQELEIWYLQQLTSQYANDLEKLRNAPDFKDASVPILIHALKQGAYAFAEGQRAVVLGGTR